MLNSISGIGRAPAFKALMIQNISSHKAVENEINDMDGFYSEDGHGKKINHRTEFDEKDLLFPVKKDTLIIRSLEKDYSDKCTAERNLQRKLLIEDPKLNLDYVFDSRLKGLDDLDEVRAKENASKGAESMYHKHVLTTLMK